MAHRIVYLPLESYKERYTMQWSAPGVGWLERNWVKYGIPYTRINGHVPGRGESIKFGVVLDAVGRSLHSMNQVSTVIQMMENGSITNDDVIYLDDFWHPGIEAIAYVGEILNVKPKIWAFLHAQSVDEFDFTHSMRSWMRNFEKGISDMLTGIFVCCPTLKDLVVHGGVAPDNKVVVTGHPFSSEEVMERMPRSYHLERSDPNRKRLRRDTVVWSSRFDAEKNPRFFLKVAETVIKRNRKIKFIVCTSAEKIRSNDPEAVERLRALHEKHPDNVFILENLTKEEYYTVLSEAKVQFNCASQDFVAITLLEASVAGCYPIYPYFRSFPETFNYQMQYMYPPGDVQAAVTKILSVVQWEDKWTNEQIENRKWIHERFDVSWIRMLTQFMMPDAVKSIPQDLWTRSVASPFASIVKSY